MAAAPSNAVDPLDFLRENLDEGFDEPKANTLFATYCVDGANGRKLEAQDVRQLVFDLLTVVSLPCVVPDITLQAVLESIRPVQGPEQRGIVTKEEFLAFVTSTPADVAPPLRRILQAVGASFDPAQLGNAVFVLFRPSRPLGDEDFYNRDVFIQFVQTMIPNATNIFVYFVRSGDAMCLVCVDGELPPFTNQTVEGTMTGDEAPVEMKQDGERPPPILIEEREYFLDIAPFNAAVDVFPPAKRVGGVRSRVARTLADTYVKARSWDQHNFQIAAKTKEAATAAIARAQAFDEQHQISAKVAAKVAQIDQQYDISGKVKAAGAKADEVISQIAANPNVQAAASRVGGVLKNVAQSVVGSLQETEQLVQERRASDAEENAAAAAVAAEQAQ